MDSGNSYLAAFWYISWKYFARYLYGLNITFINIRKNLADNTTSKTTQHQKRGKTNVLFCEATRNEKNNPDVINPASFGIDCRLCGVGADH